MPLRRVLALAATLVVTSCGGDAPATARRLPPGLPAEGSLLRLPGAGGRATLLRGDSLTPLDWAIDDDIPAIARGLGTDLEARIVYAVDTKGRLIGIDLLARRVRVHLAAARQLSATPDGVILGLDSAGHALRFAARSLTTYRASLEPGPTALLQAPGAKVIAANARVGVLQVLSEDGEAQRIDAPSGRVTSTWYGDVVAVTTDSGVMLIDPNGRPEPRFVELDGNPTLATFSPSGHRLYVARKTGDLVIVDPGVADGRFRGDELGRLSLPAEPSALRIDPSGRWLLAKPARGDSVWLVDLVRRERTATLRTRWADDLPLVSGGRTLVSRDGPDVVAWDIAGLAPVERSRLAGAAGDVFMVVPWAPRAAAPPEQVAIETSPVGDDSAATVADSVAAPATDSALAVPQVELPPVAPAPSPSGSVAIYIQVSSSQNVEWARAFADQLRQGGFPSRVLEPTTPEDGFRVVVGPYSTREEADAAGRRLGRPYFILTPGAGGT